MTPEEKLLRAIFGEKASDVRDTSLRVPPGVNGTVVEVRVFSRRGVEKDERALAIERAEIERLAKDRDDEKAILERSFYGRLKDLLVQVRRPRSAGPRAWPTSNTKITEKVLSDFTPGQWRQIAVERQAPEVDIEALNKQFDESIDELTKRFENKVDKLQRGDELPPGVMKMVKVFVAVKRKLQPGDKMAGRHGNKGVISKIIPMEDMPYTEDGTPGRHRAQPARRAEPHERGPDPGDPPRLGLRRPRPADRRGARRGAPRHQGSTTSRRS